MGFGHDQFGYFPFGFSGWAKKAVWESFPARHRDQDVDGYLELLCEAIAEELHDLTTNARLLPIQRDPYLARGPSVSEQVEVDLASTEVHPDFGTVVTLRLVNEIVDIGPGWFSTDSNGSVMTVVAIRSANLPNELLVDARFPPTLTGPTQVFSFYQPSLLPYFARDFGVEIDQYEPEFLQRSTIANVTKWWALKATAKSYDVRGKIAGFYVEARGLYRIMDTDLLYVLPPENTYEVPAGSGQWYTDIDPRAIRYDEIIADVISADEVYIHEDTSPDGMSPAMAWAEDLGAVTVVSSSPMTNLQLLACGLSTGYAVDTLILPAVHEIVGVWGGSFSLVSDFADPNQPLGTEFILDAEWSWDGVSAQTLLMGVQTAPLPGAYHLRYHPDIETTCSFCRSHTIVVLMTPSQTIIDSGVDLVKAALRLVEKLKPLIPIHVTVSDYIFAVVVNVDANTSPSAPLARRTVVLDEVSVSMELVVPRVAYYDLTLGDVIPADTFVVDVEDTITVTP